MNLADLNEFVAAKWDDDLVPQLDYVRILAKSPAFDASWEAHGHLRSVVKAAEEWCRQQSIEGLAIEIVAIEGKTPCLLFDVPATHGLGNDRTVLFYEQGYMQLPTTPGWGTEVNEKAVSAHPAKRAAWITPSEALRS